MLQEAQEQQGQGPEQELLKQLKGQHQSVAETAVRAQALTKFTQGHPWAGEIKVKEQSIPN